MAKLLVADDDRHFLNVLARFFEAEGYEVVACRNGQEALDRARSDRPDALVLDVALPLVTGDAIARQVEAPVLFISGRDLDRTEGLSGDRFRFLKKPADLDEVLVLVRELLGE